MKNQPAMQGSASVLIILVMLSLSAFGVLSMMSAYSDLKLARKNADFITQYYALDAQATEAYSEAQATYRQLVAGGTTSGEATQVVSAAGWAYDERGALLSREFTQNELHLTVELRPIGGELAVVRWQEWQEPFEYEGEPSEIWDGT